MNLMGINNIYHYKSKKVLVAQIDSIPDHEQLKKIELKLKEVFKVKAVIFIRGELIAVK